MFYSFSSGSTDDIVGTRNFRKWSTVQTSVELSAQNDINETHMKKPRNPNGPPFVAGSEHDQPSFPPDAFPNTPLAAAKVVLGDGLLALAVPQKQTLAKIISERIRVDHLPVLISLRALESRWLSPLQTPPFLR